MEKSLLLRYRVFYKEKLRRVKLFGFDADRYDRHADHLIIIDKNSNQVVGTYRVLSSAYTKKFYSETEFDITQLKNKNNTLLELGRAAIDKKHRNGVVLSLLWQGISMYARKVNAGYVFGLSSVFGEDIEKAVKIYNYLNSKGLIDHSFHIRPLEKFKVKNFERFIHLYKFDETTKKDISPLLFSYLKAGAVVCGYPAYDAKFRCFDFFTLLEVDKLNKRFERKFKR
ncbi:MAG: GNAT family N-acyltransferase [Persephonella sp.]|nr:GNAT family N-acyltransferase [Persephonella sp.]